MKWNLHLAAAAFAAPCLIFSSLASAQDATPAGRGADEGDEATLRLNRHPMKFVPTGP